MVWICEACGADGDVQGDVDHYSDCVNKFKVRKFCDKSGTHPHD